MTPKSGQTEVAFAFDDAHASRYDEQFVRLSPLMGALHLLMRGFFAELPEQARVLCVGAGTGAELLELARAFPRWRFVAVDPSAPMLAVCRRKAEAAGVLDRCEFHAGYLASLPAMPPFDAATCVLVSQFVLDRAERIGLFRQIADRLVPGGRLLSADLCADLDDPVDGEILDLWMGLIASAGQGPKDLEQLRTIYRQHVSVLPAVQVEFLLRAAGFTRALPIYQSLMIRAWACRVAGERRD